MTKSYDPFRLPLDYRHVLALSVFGGFLSLDLFHTGKPATGVPKLGPHGWTGRVAGIAAHIVGMMKRREDLDLATIVDGAISNYLEDRKLTGAAPFEQQTTSDLKRMREAFLPVIWSSLPSILIQLNTKAAAAEATPEEILADFTVPDSLEGLVQ